MSKKATNEILIIAAWVLISIGLLGFGELLLWAFDPATVNAAVNAVCRIVAGG